MGRREVLTPHSPRISCAECEALAARRDRLWQSYSETMGALIDYSYTSTDIDKIMRLRVVASRAKLDLDVVKAEIRQHQDRHVVPN